MKLVAHFAVRLDPTTSNSPDIQTMNHAVRIANNQPAPTRCEISKTKTPHHPEGLTPRPGFASRMIRLVFKRGQRGTEQRAKSWPGRVEPVPVPVPVSTSLKHQPSATIAIPNSFTSSDPSTMSAECTRLQRLRKYSADDSCSQAHWRQRQTRCINCERLFFKSMSTLSTGSCRFCSLDCKANFEYMHQLQEVADMQTRGISDVSSGWSDQVEVDDSCCDVGTGWF